MTYTPNVPDTGPFVWAYGVDGLTPVTSENPYPVTTGGLPAASITSTTTAIPNSSTLVTLTAPSTNVVIVNQSASATLYINFNGAATSSNGGIAPGATYIYSGVAISTFHVLGSAASGNYVIFAN